jgi:hemerythrin-like domain-containing protein
VPVSAGAASRTRKLEVARRDLSVSALSSLLMASDDHATPTALLRREHELILEVAGALSGMLADHENAPLDYDAVSRCITFFRLYADACHHGKEESILFPALVAHGLPEEAGPVAVMLQEHEEGRAMVREMAASLAGARAGETTADVNLRNAAADFVELITAHIGKENNILFDMADQLISGPACHDLCAAYGELSDERFEGRSKLDLVSVARTIVDRP